VDEPALRRVGAGVQQRGEPLLGPGEFFVAGRQHAADGEYPPQVADRREWPCAPGWLATE